jgi:NADPH:quinone reductase-like Zn-dependent oxidoreductase
MRAIVQDRYGPPEILEMRDIDKPVIGDDQVLVRVCAASVNPPDWAGTTGIPRVVRLAMGLRRPKNPVRGTDLAGVVEAVGRDVTRFHAGDEVFGAAAATFAEYAAAREKNLVRKPANVTFEQAGSVAMAAVTALLALRDAGRIQRGQKVLIIGAGGGIGTFAVQMAREFGAQVTGVCGTDKVDLVRSLGAAQVIDYTKEDFTSGTVRYDLILDNVSRMSISKLRRSLNPGGVLVPNGGRFDHRWTASLPTLISARLRSMFLRQRVRTFLAHYTTADLQIIADMMASGKLVPVIGRTYPLSETPAAIGHFAAGHTRGKIAIAI